MDSQYIFTLTSASHFPLDHFDREREGESATAFIKVLLKSSESNLRLRAFAYRYHLAEQV